LTSADQNIGKNAGYVHSPQLLSVNEDTDQGERGFYGYEEASCILCVLPRGGTDDQRVRLLARTVDGTDSRRLTWPASLLLE